MHGYTGNFYVQRLFTPGNTDYCQFDVEFTYLYTRLKCVRYVVIV